VLKKKNSEPTAGEEEKGTFTIKKGHYEAKQVKPPALAPL